MVKKQEIFVSSRKHTALANLNCIGRQNGDIKSFFASYSSNSRGIEILLNNTFEHQINHTITDPNGRYLFVDMVINNYRINLIHVYRPNDNSDYFVRLKSQMEIMPHSTFIIGGDRYPKYPISKQSEVTINCE
jgi:hypothetical protein